MIKKILVKLNKFVIGGTLNFLLILGLTMLLTEVFSIWYLLSYIMSLFCGIVFSFFYNAYITFGVKGDKIANFIKYGIALGIFYVIDVCSVSLLTEVLNIYYALSIMIVSFFVFLMKFFVYDKLVFIKKDKK